MDVPQGLVSLPGPGNAVGAHLHIGMKVMMWLSMVLVLGLGVVFLIAGPGTGEDKIPAWVPWMFIALGLYVGYLAWRTGTRPKYVIDDEGIRSDAVFGKALVRWDAIQGISLSQPRGNAIWFTAPGGILRGGKVLKKKSIPIMAAGLTIRPAALFDYIVARARENA